MSWKKHFKVIKVDNVSPLTTGASHGDFSYRNYQYQLPEVYVGHANRLDRYQQYEAMDADTEVNSALDIIAEFCTQTNIENKTMFDLQFHEEPTDREVKILKEQLQQWVRLNELNKRGFKMFRNVLKYGDQVFLRDPETFKMFWVEMCKVTKVIVNESEGKEPEQYVVKDIGPNFQNLTVTQVAATDAYTSSPGAGGAGTQGYQQSRSPYTGGSRFSHQSNETAINAEHVIHLSLTEGLDPNWPFGTSILEMIFKVYKQKELLEDAILIYRIQRAPERRIFKIDVGNMPSHLAMAFVERVKNEIHQRRIPSQNGAGGNVIDATYNPLSINEDYFFPVTADGRGSDVTTLPGGQNLGEIDDLRFFTNKLFRGLRIPSSYLPTGPEDGTMAVADGRVGTALIQEWRFNQYCMRLQSLVCEKLDDEFKLFLRWRGINIDSSLFNIEFNDPQNFASYKQSELDSTRTQAFSALEQLPYMSKRFLLKRFLGLTDEEMQENDKMWEEEKGPDGGAAGGPAQGAAGAGGDAGLRGVGVTPGGIEGDMNTADLAAQGDEAAMAGGEPGVPGAMPSGTAPGGMTSPTPGIGGTSPISGK